MGQNFGASLGSGLLGWRNEVSVAENKTLITCGQKDQFPRIHNLTLVSIL